jgi:hypothetical protein
MKFLSTIFSRPRTHVEGNFQSLVLGERENTHHVAGKLVRERKFIARRFYVYPTFCESLFQAERRNFLFGFLEQIFFHILRLERKKKKNRRQSISEEKSFTIAKGLCGWEKRSVIFDFLEKAFRSRKFEI